MDYFWNNKVYKLQIRLVQKKKMADLEFAQ